MSTRSRPEYSPAATAAFAELVARHDRGELIDFESEFERHEAITSELRALHANWRRLDRLLSGLQGHESALDSLERELRRPATPPDESTRSDLERLSSPQRSLARYVARERLARGGMGEIWRVHDRDLGRDLAMKTIRTRGTEGSRTPDGRLLRRFLFEARLTGRLDHPGIVPVHDIGVDAEGRLFFTMPLVRGKSLREILDLAATGSGGWTRPRVLEVVLRVCDTLAFAHAQGVVHRDLKPANVMVGRFGETYVMDWGLARVLAEVEELADGARAESETSGGSATATRDGEVLGTPAYMSPEQAKGRQAEVGPRSDVYAVGAILYHLLAGKPPYADDPASGDVILDAVRAGPPPRLDALQGAHEAELVAIAEKAMARSPDARYPDMVAMASDLRAYMEGRVVGAHDVGTVVALRKWLARNRTLAITVAVALAVVAVGSALFLRERSRSEDEIVRLADARRLEALDARSETLWPAIPANAPALEAWLAEAQDLTSRTARHERALAELRRRAKSEWPWRFASAEEQWQHDTLADLVDRLSRFKDPHPSLGAIASVSQRLASAREVGRLSLDEAATAWDEARASIADERACPAYRGLEIVPQVGLVPIGRDPESGLWEFAHVASGTVPARGADGRLELTLDGAIVLVLVPGGRFHMGSRAPLPGASGATGVDASAAEDEMPATEIEITAFFLAKYEATEAQWRRLRAGEPDEREWQLLPASALSCVEAERELGRVGLALPTEAQWEYAARAGTTSRWWCGAEPGSLRGVANGAPAGDPRLARGEPRSRPLPVNVLRPNPFGLVHVHGNVAEWTRGAFAPYTVTPAPRDGARGVAENGLRAVRGGGFTSAAIDMRSAARSAVARDNHDPRIGFRAARAVDGAGR